MFPGITANITAPLFGHKLGIPRHGPPLQSRTLHTGKGIWNSVELKPASKLLLLSPDEFSELFANWAFQDTAARCSDTPRAHAKASACEAAVSCNSIPTLNTICMRFNLLLISTNLNGVDGIITKPNITFNRCLFMRRECASS